MIETASRETVDAETNLVPAPQDVLSFAEALETASEVYISLPMRYYQASDDVKEQLKAWKRERGLDLVTAYGAMRDVSDEFDTPGVMMADPWLLVTVPVVEGQEAGLLSFLAKLWTLVEPCVRERPSVALRPREVAA